MPAKRFCASVIVSLFTCLISIPLSAQPVRSTSVGVVLRDTISINPRAEAFSTLTTPVIDGGYNATYSITATEVQEAHFTKIIIHTPQLDTTPILNAYMGQTNNVKLGRVDIPSEITIEAYTYNNVPMTVSIVEWDPHTYGVYYNGASGGRILLSERVPKPFVRINTPRNAIFTLNKDYKPVVTPTINYSPTSGEFVPIVTVSPSQINTAEYYELLNTTEYVQILITATASNERGTASDTASFFITRDRTPESFRVTITPDNLQYGDTATVKAIALDENGEEINMPEDWWVAVWYDPFHNLYTEEEYYLEAGNLTSPSEGSGVAITVPYSELKNGEVKFIANGEMKIGSTPVDIHVGYADREGMSVVTITDILDHFTVTLGNNTMEYNGRVDIARVIAQDSDSNQLNLYWDTPLMITDAPSGFGHLEAAPISFVVRGAPAKPNIDSLLRAKIVQLLQGDQKINPLQRAFLQTLSQDSHAQLAASVKKEEIDLKKPSGSAKEKKKSVQKIAEEEPEPTEFIVQYSDGYWDGSYYYVADGTEPQNDTTITFTVNAVEKPSARGTADVLILPPGCPEIILAKEHVNPGDTVGLTVKKKLRFDGRLVNYPSGTTFNIGIDVGAEYGNLLAYGELAPSFDYVEVPIQFVANGDIPTDSVSLQILATVNSAGGGTAGKVKSQNKQGQQVLRAKKNGQKFRMVDGFTCIGSITFAVQDIILEIIEPKEGQLLEKYITAEPKMPADMKVKAQLKNYDGDAIFNIRIPKLKWKAPGTSIETEGYYDASGHGKGEVEITFTFTDPDYIRGGDDMQLEADALTTNKGEFTAKPVKNPFKIIGKNPSLSSMLTVLGDDMYKAIAYQESKFNQFHSRTSSPAKMANETPAFPLQGGLDPNDIGIMQIHIPSNANIIWNWKANIEEGKNNFNKCIEKARVYHERADIKKDFDPPPTPLNDALTQNDMFVQAYCYYNAGLYSGIWYWEWVPGDPEEDTPGYWKKQTDSWKTTLPNADKIKNIYLTKPWLK